MLCRRDLICGYEALIVSRLLYASPVFVGLNSRLSAAIEKVRKRAHRIICGVDCKCDSFPSLSAVRMTQASNLFTAAEKCVRHPLHFLIPQRLPFSGALRLPVSYSSRRSASFVPFMCMFLNDLS